MVKEKIKSRKGSDGPQWRLLTPPPPSEWLKEGYVVKQTHRHKWAKNYLVVKNAADSYACHYFPSEKEKNDEKKAHGQIALYGMYPREFNDEEKKEHESELGITLDPWSRSRRTWYFKMSSPEELNDWLGTLKYASRYAPRPMNPDPVLQAAFIAAYRKAWWYFPGWCGPYPGWGGTEEEDLAALIIDRCDREFMYDVYNKLPSGFLHNTVRKKVRGILESTVGAAVAAGWKAAQEGLAKVRGEIDKIVEESVEPVAGKQQEIEHKLGENGAAKMSPVLEKIAGPILEPLCKIMIEPVVTAFQKVVDIWFRKMSANPSLQTAKQISEYSRYWSQMDEVWSIIRDFCRSNAFQGLQSLLYDFRSWRIEDEMENATSLLLRKAAYTFTKDLEELNDATRAFQSVNEKLIADCKVMALQTITDIFESILNEPFQREVVPLLSDILEPLTKLIPEGPLQKIMDIDSMLENVLKHAVKQVVNKVIRPMAEQKCGSIALRA